MARRKSLFYALGCDEMKQYLTGFNWKREEWREIYFQIFRAERGSQGLKDASNFRPEDEEVDRQNVFKQALKASMLDILLLTGPREPDHFDAFWTSPEDGTAQAVRFAFQHHGWGKLLEDSVTSFSASF